jgi:signal peptidase
MVRGATTPSSWRAPLRKAWRLAVGGVLLVVVGSLALLAVSSRMGYQNLFVRSESMTGFAPIGSLVVARPIQPRDIKVGDVILIRGQHEDKLGAPVLHRVIERNIDQESQVVVRTKGDANPDPDREPYVVREPTITPVLVVRWLGFVLALIRTPVGWLGLVVLPAVLLLSVVLVGLWSPTEEESRGISPGRT